MPDTTPAAIWDMDGVLVLSGELHHLAWQQVLQRYGLSMSREDFDRTFGMNNRNLLRRIYGERLSLEQIDAIAAEKEAAYRAAVRGRVQPLPGVRDWLGRLSRAGWRQAVASSAPMANIAAILAELDLWHEFDVILTGERLPRSKPDPALFLQAAAALGAEPARCVVIEDATVGVEAGKHAGMRVIAVTTTHPAEDLAAADLVVDRLDHLPADAFEQVLGTKTQRR
ncbi:MAG: HAD family hydrolase [Anaerolineae bacterium]